MSRIPDYHLHMHKHDPVPDDPFIHVEAILLNRLDGREIGRCRMQLPPDFPLEKACEEAIFLIRGGASVSPIAAPDVVPLG